MPAPRDNWHQPNPGMQLTTILNNFEGSYLNWKEKIVKDQAFTQRMDLIFEELQELRPFLQGTTWPDSHIEVLKKKGFVL